MIFNRNPLTIAIDFDSTLVDVISYPREMKLKPLVRGSLEHLTRNLGAQLILWTCRQGKDLECAKEFLESQDLLHFFTKINENTDFYVSRGWDPRKVCCDILIDDTCVFFNPDWNEIIKAIERRLT